MKRYSIEVKWAFIFIGSLLIWMLLEKWAGLHDTYIHFASIHYWSLQHSSYSHLCICTQEHTQTVLSWNNVV